MAAIPDKNTATVSVSDICADRIWKLEMHPAIREAIENHKSNWIPGSRGGEPNCRRE